MPTRLERFAAVIDGETIYNADELPEIPDRFLLVERSRYDASIFVTSWETADHAAEYHDGQEEPDDWPILLLVDLDSGDRFEPTTTTSWAKVIT